MNMPVKTAVCLALCVVLLGVAPALGGEKAAPEGLCKIVLDTVPDLAGFPPGTEEIKIATVVKHDGKVFELEWEFEREEPGMPLLPKKCDVDARVDDGSFVFPKKAPALGPMESVKAVLLAMHARDFEKLRPFLNEEDAEKLLEDMPGEIDEIERSAGKEYGITLETFAETLLPRDGALSPLCASIEIRFEFLLEAGGRMGLFEVDLELRASKEEAGNWTLEDMDADFKPLEEGEEHAPLRRDPVAPEGLRKSIEPFLLPDFSAFPAGTERVELECHRRVGKKWFRIEGDFRVPDGGTELWIAGFRVDEDKGEGMDLPVAPFDESALQSLLSCIEAMRKGDLDTFLKYMDSKAREEIQGLPREEAIRMLQEGPKEEAEKKGFSPVEVILANLPEQKAKMTGVSEVELRFRFPGELRGKAGAFELELAMRIEGPHAKSWVFDELDVDFD